MFQLNVETDANCVPCISNAYIDDFCNGLIRRFEPSVISKLHPVNIEQFVRQFLGLSLKIENLSSDRSILGATTFIDIDRFPVYDPEKRRAKFISAKEGTVFIDRSLTARSKNNRYRFTLAHEAGHAIWHGMYYAARVKEGECKQKSLNCESKYARLRSAADCSRIIEHQADRSASALLMPRDAVYKLMEPMGECHSYDDAMDRIMYTASLFRVSEAAARIRLVNLGLVDASLIRAKILARQPA